MFAEALPHFMAPSVDCYETIACFLVKTNKVETYSYIRGAMTSSYKLIKAPLKTFISPKEICGQSIITFYLELLHPSVHDPWIYWDSLNFALCCLAWFDAKLLCVF